MINHDIDLQLRQFGFGFRHFRQVEIKLQMPAQFLQSRRKTFAVSQRQAFGFGGEVDAHATHAGGMQIGEFTVRDSCFNYRDAAQRMQSRTQGIDHAAVVGAVDAGLYQHAAVAAVVVQHADIIRGHCIGRDVGGVVEVRKTRLWPEHMRVAIAGAVRKTCFGFLGMRNEAGNVECTYCRHGLLPGRRESRGGRTVEGRLQ